MSITAYEILSANSAGDLGGVVAAAISDGWQPVGSVLETDGRFCQTMIKGAPNVSNFVGADAAVADGDTVTVHNSTVGDAHSATAVVAANSLSGVTLAATVAMVDDGDTVAVHNSAGADSHNATAEVALGVITDVKFAATVAMVDNSDTVVVHNSAGSVIAGTHSAEVALGVLTDVKLASTVAGVTNGLALTGVTPSGVYTTTVTFTVASGVITAIALS